MDKTVGLAQETQRALNDLAAGGGDIVVVMVETPQDNVATRWMLIRSKPNPRRQAESKASVQYLSASRINF